MKTISEFGRHVLDKICELEAKQKKIEDDLRFYKTMRDKILGVCPKCNGQGEVRVIIDMDSFDYELCNRCKGLCVANADILKQLLNQEATGESDV